MKLRFSGRQFLTLFAVFIAALLLGYLGESQSVQTSDLVTRNEVMSKMARIIKNLAPVLKPQKSNNQKFAMSNELPEEVELIAQLGLVKNFPDGSWRLQNNLTRGEALSYFGKLVEYLKSQLSYQQLTLEGTIMFEDIPAGHWLEKDLKSLSGIGALSEFRTIKLFPDDLMRMNEIRALSATIIEYFSSNMLILTKEEDSIRVLPKGALKNLTLNDWEVSFDDNEWYKVPQNGIIPVIKSTNAVALFFRHRQFLKVGPVEMPSVGAATAFVKLRRDYVSFVKDKLENFKDEPEMVQSDIERVKSRLAEIKRKRWPEKYPAPEVTENTEAIAQKAAEPAPEITLEPVAKPANAVTFKSRLKNRSNERKDLPYNNRAVKPAVTRKVDSGLFTIKGKIIDALNKIPVPGAMLVVNGIDQKLDEAGNFSISARRHEIIEITAYCEGYDVLQMKHRVGYRSDNLLLRLKPQLTSFSGRVITYESMQPVERALIRVGDKATRTNSDGTFNIRGIRPGYHQVSCFARNFLEAHEIVFVDEKQNDSFTFEIRREFTFDNVSDTANEVSYQTDSWAEVNGTY
jgi:hypothetical protein